METMSRGHIRVIGQLAHCYLWHMQKVQLVDVPELYRLSDTSQEDELLLSEAIKEAPLMLAPAVTDLQLYQIGETGATPATKCTHDVGCCSWPDRQHLHKVLAAFAVYAVQFACISRPGPLQGLPLSMHARILHEGKRDWNGQKVGSLHPSTFLWCCSSERIETACKPGA